MEATTQRANRNILDEILSSQQMQPKEIIKNGMNPTMFSFATVPQENVCQAIHLKVQILESRVRHLPEPLRPKGLNTGV